MPYRLRKTYGDWTFPSVAGSREIRLTWRVAAFIIIAVAEVLVGSALRDSPSVAPSWPNPIVYANRLALIGLLSFVAFTLMAWPRRGQIARIWKASAQRQNWGAAVFANLSLFAMFLLARITLFQSNPQATDLYWYWAYSFLLIATGASLALIAAPLSLWRELAKIAPIEIIMAVIAAGFVLFVGWQLREGWYWLSSRTLDLSHFFLELFGASPHLDTENNILRVEDFWLQISKECSGYEGVSLIVIFLCIYFWVFRNHLRFPNALILLPVGIVTIWVLNSVRLALLVLVGAHISPIIAMSGAHSWFGWITFLGITIGILAVVPQIQYLWRFSGHRLQAAEDSGYRHLVACLSPFAALMAASIVASAFAPEDQWLYTLKVVAVGAVLWWFRDVYADIVSAVSPISIAAGLLVGVLWIATDPKLDAEAPLGLWLTNLPASLAFLWLTLRVVGSVVFVPMAEELAFRGYLYRALSSLRFQALSPVQIHWVALIVSSLAFGLLHERWLAATLAGVVFALVMYRNGKLSDAIAAHMASNAAIVAWSIATEQWTLL